MLAEIRQTFKSLEDKRGKVLQQLDLMPSETVHFKAGADKWSVVEAIEHLVIAEESMLDQLTAGASAVNLDPRDRSAKNFQIVIKVMERDIPVDVPDESLKPHGKFKLEELLDRWDTVRQKTSAYIEAIGSDDAADLVYRHPFAGPLDMTETLRFLDVHFDNHMRHLETVRARAK